MHLSKKKTNKIIDKQTKKLGLKIEYVKVSG